MNNKTAEHNPGASETARFFCTRLSPAAGAAGELCIGKRKEPDMAKRNTNPGIGESTDSGVMHNPSPRARVRTHAWLDLRGFLKNPF